MPRAIAGNWKWTNKRVRQLAAFIDDEDMSSSDMAKQFCALYKGASITKNTLVSALRNKKVPGMLKDLFGQEKTDALIKKFREGPRKGRAARIRNGTTSNAPRLAGVKVRQPDPPKAVVTPSPYELESRPEKRVFVCPFEVSDPETGQTHACGAEGPTKYCTVHAEAGRKLDVTAMMAKRKGAS